MNSNLVFKRLKEQIGDMAVRRYSLPEIISESYNSYYKCEEGTNLKELVESHLNDLRSNPSDTERLSKNLSIIKSLISLTESGEILDADIVEEETPKRRCRPSHRMQESCPPAKRSAKDTSNKGLSSLSETDDVELTEEEVEELAKHLETIRKERKGSSKGAPKKTVEESQGRGRKLKKRVSEKCSHKKELQENDDSITIKDKTGASMKFVKIGDDKYTWVNKNGEYMDNNGTPVKLDKTGSPVGGRGYSIFSKKQIDSMTSTNESKSYDAKSLKEFTKKSAGKAFVKTFKKMNEKLHEGTALTRQESINLYKAANSAMTHLSVELEHNPEFLNTFTECVSILSKDVNSVLGALKENKAPSKSTMKSLAKFSESILLESEDEKMTSEEMKEYWAKNKKSDPVLAQYKSYDAWYKDSKENGYVKDEEYPDDLDEAEKDEEVEEPTPEDTEGDIPPIEDEEDDFVGDDEGEITSEEEDQFNQEYADARVEIHKELASKYEDTEDPAIQEKIEQDKEEVLAIAGEDALDEEREDSDTDDTEEPDSDEESGVSDDESDITDDELAELKKHLTEIRKNKKPIDEALDTENSLVNDYLSQLDANKGNKSKYDEIYRKIKSDSKLDKKQKAYFTDIYARYRNGDDKVGD